MAVKVEPPTAVVKPPGFEVAVYPVMAEPPSSGGAVHETAAEFTPSLALMLVGGPGTVDTVMLLDGDEVAPTTWLFEGVTVNGYETPLVSPDMDACVDVAEVVVLSESGVDRTINWVTGNPPSSTGAAQVIVALARAPSIVADTL